MYFVFHNFFLKVKESIIFLQDCSIIRLCAMSDPCVNSIGCIFISLAVGLFVFGAFEASVASSNIHTPWPLAW